MTLLNELGQRGRSVGLWFSLLAAASAMTLMATVAHAQQSPVVSVAPGERVYVGESITLNVGRSQAFKSDWTIRDLSVADADVVGVQALEPNEFWIMGLSPGVTDIILWGDGGQVWSTEIVVDVDLERLNQDLDRLFPNATLEATRSEGVYFVTGILERAEHSQKLHDFFETAELKYVDMTRLAGVQQVQIKVRVAEVNRQAIKRMGANALYGDDSFFGASLVGSASGGAFNPISIGALEGATALGNIPFVFTEDVGVSPFVTLLAGFPGSDLEFFIQALAENQYLRVLAEPTLVALSGEQASFLAGGEFPIPIVQGSSAGGGTSITIEYKEFGVRLSFTPTVLGDGSIRLHIAPEVSDLSNVGAVEIEGFSIPSVLTRRAETTLELKSGQTFSMAGLLNHTVNARNSRIPFLGDLPILGTLFRSTTYQEGESELVVLVTPSLVEADPAAATRPLPGDLHITPNDWEIYALGHIQGRVQEDPEDGMAHLDVEGLEELRGPGAWASHFPEDEPKREAATEASEVTTIKMQTSQATTTTSTQTSN